uniref:Uncharacterized protein n=1 Tax=Parascaris univalens TaxID=6257 RepID=A0A915ADC4_PARUN
YGHCTQQFDVNRHLSLESSMSSFVLTMCLQARCTSSKSNCIWLRVHQILVFQRALSHLFLLIFIAALVDISSKITDTFLYGSSLLSSNFARPIRNGDCR